MEVKSVTKANTEIQPPDGGWGWAVCFAAFMSNFTVSGITATNGIILLGLRDLFNESITKTSLVSSFLSGATMFGGPLVLVLIIYKASHRQIMMLAGIIAVASAVASMFAPSVEILILTYGILARLSLAMSYFAGNIVLGYYFDKKRALALGIANSGTGCGSFFAELLHREKRFFLWHERNISVNWRRISKLGCLWFIVSATQARRQNNSLHIRK